MDKFQTVVKRDDELGALWLKTGKTGEKFLSGIINLADGTEQKVLVFPNRHKKTDNHPDYRIIKATEGYQRWLEEAQTIAGVGGIQALQDAFKRAHKDIRAYLTQVDAERWQQIKAIAAEYDQRTGTDATL